VAEAFDFQGAVCCAISAGQSDWSARSIGLMNLNSERVEYVARALPRAQLCPVDFKDRWRKDFFDGLAAMGSDQILQRHSEISLLSCRKFDHLGRRPRMIVLPHPMRLQHLF